MIQNPLKKYLERDGEEKYGSEVVRIAKITGLSENSIRNISRYYQPDVEGMQHGTYKKLLALGVNMDKWEE